MYISSFNTYVDSSVKSDTSLLKSTYKTTFEFQKLQKLQKKDNNTLSTPLKSLPINYISQNKYFISQLTLQHSNKEFNISTKIYSSSKKLLEARDAYGSSPYNTFPLQHKNSRLAEELTPTTQLKKRGVNIYVENGRYYQTTA